MGACCLWGSAGKKLSFLRRHRCSVRSTRQAPIPVKADTTVYQQPIGVKLFCWKFNTNSPNAILVAETESWGTRQHTGTPPGSALQGPYLFKGGFLLPSFAFSGSAVQSDPFRHLKSKPNSISRRPRGAGVVSPGAPCAAATSARRTHLWAHSSCQPTPLAVFGLLRLPQRLRGEQVKFTEPSATSATPRRTDGRAGAGRGGACLKGVGSQVPAVIVLGKHPLPGPAPLYASPHPSIHPSTPAFPGHTPPGPVWGCGWGMEEPFIPSWATVLEEASCRHLQGGRWPGEVPWRISLWTCIARGWKRGRSCFTVKDGLAPFSSVLRANQAWGKAAVPPVLADSYRPLTLSHFFKESLSGPLYCYSILLSRSKGLDQSQDQTRDFK